MGLSVSDYTNVIQAGVGIAGALGAVIAFVWVRVENISRRTRREVDRCNAERVQDRIMARERRALLLAVIDGLLSVVKRRDPFAPEISETQERLADFRARERIEAELEREES